MRVRHDTNLKKYFYQTYLSRLTIPASYTGIPGSNRLSSLRRFVDFLRPSGQMAVQYPKSDHHRFLPHPFQFINHHTYAILSHLFDTAFK
jgi:hypothetical protein